MKPDQPTNTMTATTEISTAAATLGRKGGKATSEAKTIAARRNAERGGRPAGYSLIGDEYWEGDRIDLGRNGLILIAWARPFGAGHEFLVRVTYKGNADHPSLPLFACRGDNVEATIRRKCDQYGDLTHLPSLLHDLRAAVDAAR